MNRRLAINLSAVAVVVVLLMLLARSMDYQPEGAPEGTTPGEAIGEVAPPQEDLVPEPVEGQAPPLAPGPGLTEAAGLVRHAEIGFASPERLVERFESYGAGLGALTADGYLLLAQALRDRPAGGDVLEKTRVDGVITRFDRASGAFLAFDPDLTIRTFFRPADGEAYFERHVPGDPE